MKYGRIEEEGVAGSSRKVYTTKPYVECRRTSCGRLLAVVRVEGGGGRIFYFHAEASYDEKKIWKRYALLKNSFGTIELYIGVLFQFVNVFSQIISL